MQVDEINRSLQQFLASVAGIERSRLAALLANPSEYLTALHAQVGDPTRAPGLPTDDATTMRQVLDLVTDSGRHMTLTEVGSALRAAAMARAIPERLSTDWRDAHSRIAGYLAEAGPLPSAPDAATVESPSPFQEARQVTREDVLRVVIDGGILAIDPDRVQMFMAWRAAPPFFAIVEQVVVRSLVDLIGTLSAMRRYIVQPAVTALASASAAVTRPFDTA